ncbi:MAG: hypothetical protein U0746_14930 [Gemmataceae bacterium]
MGKLTVLVSGMIAGVPGQGGATWAVLQYVLGLRRLGHDVVLAEPVKELTPASVAYFHQVATDFQLERSAALVKVGTRETVGLDYRELVTKRPDVLLNVSGMLTDPELIGQAARRVYLDLDPGFVQLWHDQGIDMRFAGHTHFVTLGQRIGQPDCPIPTCDIDWIPTAQPVVLDRWPVATGPYTRNALTAIGNWRGYGSVERNGVFYGQKCHSLRPLLDLPTRARERFQLALAIHSGEVRDLEALAANGWELLDSVDTAGTPARYRDFIRSSKAEFGLAKSGYVAARCGWFSDRSCCYLASGRPVIAQDTAFGRWLPTGEGLFAFSTADDVLAATEALNADYPRHARAARRIAEELFDSDKVLALLLERIGVT